jgi:hypothetical protein
MNPENSKLMLYQPLETPVEPPKTPFQPLIKTRPVVALKLPSFTLYLCLKKFHNTGGVR